MNKIVMGLGSIAIALIITVCLQHEQNRRLRQERNKYKANTQAMFSGIKRMQIDSAMTAADVNVLKLSLDEYKRYRAEDLEHIRKLNLQVKSVQSVAKHGIEVDADIKAELKDTLVIRDTVTVQLKKVAMNTPYLQVNGVIENNRLTGKIYLPVTLYQVVWTEHKHRFLWWKWGVKAIHQTISSDNPYVQIKYSQMVQIQK